MALSGRGGARLLRVVGRRGGVGAEDGSQHRLGEVWTRGAAGSKSPWCLTFRLVPGLGLRGGAVQREEERG